MACAVSCLIDAHHAQWVVIKSMYKFMPHNNIGCRKAAGF